MEIVAFTNGCFDILHPGHIELLKKAAALGTKLIVGLNSDSSVRAIKGSPRPFFNQEARFKILSELRAVDEVRIFDENTPEKLIREIKPDVLVKGGDWSVGQIVGADFVLKNGGKVFSIPFESDFSSSRIVEKIKNTGAASTPFLEGENPVLEKDEKAIDARIENLRRVLKTEIPNIRRCFDLILRTLKNGKKIIICGDEESFFPAQITGRAFADSFGSERVVMLTPPAESKKVKLENTVDDLPIQIRRTARSGDLFIGAAFEDASPRMLSAVMQARDLECFTMALTKMGGKKISSLCDANLYAPFGAAPQICEFLLFVVGYWREIYKAQNRRINSR